MKKMQNQVVAVSRGMLPWALGAAVALAACGDATFGPPSPGTLDADVVIELGARRVQTIDFGTVLEGTSSSRDVTVRRATKKRGVAPAISLASGDQGFALDAQQRLACIEALDALADCLLTVLFAPSQNQAEQLRGAGVAEGLFEDELLVDGHKSQTVHLTGTLQLADSGLPDRCNDGVCAEGEDCTSCPADCGDCGPACGNGICETPETCDACAMDCGSCTSTGTRYVTTSAELASAIGSAMPGDEIIATRGVYEGTFDLDRSGTATSPIVVRSEQLGDAVLSNATITLSGNHVWLQGFTVLGRGVSVQGDHNRVTRNVFREGGSSPAILVAGPSRFNRFDHNEITGWNNYGFLVRAHSESKGNLIDHNYIHDNTQVSNGEAIKIGSGREQTFFELETIVERNYFENIGTDEETEIVSVKSSGNVIRENTFERSADNAFYLRHGVRNTVTNNTFIDIRLVVLGDEHVIVGNHIVNEDIKLRSGDCTQDQVPTGGGCMPVARHCTIAANTVENGKILIESSQSVGNILAANDAAIDDRGTGTIYADRYAGEAGEAVLLTPSMVGPNAP